jgi:hypothetical protein
MSSKEIDVATTSKFGSPLIRGINRATVAMMRAPLLGKLVRRGLVTIRYVGRKSGKTIELPVGYRRTGDTVVIAVGMPDAKAWWHNFSGVGAPMTLVGIDGHDRTGYAVATRDDRGAVSVTVRLD